MKLDDLKDYLDDEAYTVRVGELRALLASTAKRCEYCDGTGDVHGIDGEWRGTCTACDAEPAPAIADTAINPEDVGLPPYPKGHVVGPCVCRSWPGGECLKCPVIPGSPAVIADTAPSAFQALKDALQADPEYAWSWHCNLAMPIMDSIRCTHVQANKAGADLMQYLFGIDIRKHPHWHHDEKVIADTVGASECIAKYCACAPDKCAVGMIDNRNVNAAGAKLCKTCQGYGYDQSGFARSCSACEGSTLERTPLAIDAADPVRDVVQAWDAYFPDRTNEQAAVLFVLAMNKLRETLASPAIDAAQDDSIIDDCIRDLMDAKTLAEKFSARNQLDLAIKRKIESGPAIDAADVFNDLRKFLDVAAGEGCEFDGVDAGDLYLRLFPNAFDDITKDSK